MFRRSIYRTVDKKHERHVGGFTTIEMAIVIIMSGLLFTAFLSAYQSYGASKRDTETIENMDLANQALREFFSIRGRYPCPADPTLGPGDMGYGEEMTCRNAPAAGDPCPSPNLVCTTLGSRDTAFDADTLPDSVVIGALPFVTIQETIGFSEFRGRNALDGYSMKLKYAVSESMAHTGNSILTPANSQWGAIDIRDENGLVLVEPQASAHYVVVSTGENKRGGFTADGGAVGGCVVTILGVTGPPPPGNNLAAAGIETEVENCDDNDAIFASGLKSLEDSDDFYDDTVYFNASTNRRLWRPSNIDPSFIYNTNPGNVGVGVNDPVFKLHVNGNIRAQAQADAENGYCDLDGDDCVSPDSLGGTDMQLEGSPGTFECPDGQVITSIENNNFNCVNVFPATIPDVSCAPGQYVKEIIINASGTMSLDCDTP